MSKAKHLLRLIAWTLVGSATVWAWPWSRDLVVQIFARPQQYSTTPPAGSIPVHWEAPLPREVAAARLRNPFAPDRQTLEQGKMLFETYCLPCHGPAGKGDGLVKGGAMLPADLTSARVQAQRDGELYHTIRNGFGTMPPYYSRLTQQERWQVILYVRTLGK